MGGMKHAALPLAFLCAVLPAAAQTVYKCPRPYGQVAYQQAPCADGAGEKIDVRPASGDGLPESIRNFKKAAQAHADAIRAVGDECVRRIDAGEIGPMRIGMPKDEALCGPGWSFPDNINAAQTAEGVQEQYVYRVRPGKNRYLYFTNGILTAIQE